MTVDFFWVLVVGAAGCGAVNLVFLAIRNYLVWRDWHS
jgi:hypothetical protein